MGRKGYLRWGEWEKGRVGDRETERLRDCGAERLRGRETKTITNF